MKRETASHSFHCHNVFYVYVLQLFLYCSLSVHVQPQSVPLSQEAGGAPPPPAFVVARSQSMLGKAPPPPPPPPTEISELKGGPITLWSGLVSASDKLFGAPPPPSTSTVFSSIKSSGTPPTSTRAFDERRLSKQKPVVGRHLGTVQQQQQQQQAQTLKTSQPGVLIQYNMYS